MKNFLRFCTLSILVALSSSFRPVESLWIKYYEDDQIKIEYTNQRCTNNVKGTDIRYILLKFNNKTNHKLQVSFQKETWFDDICSNCESNSEEHNKVVLLNPNETLEGACDSENAFKIFYNMPSGHTKTILTKFELKNIQSVIIQ